MPAKRIRTQYPQLMRAPHRRQAFPVDAPALSRHVSIRVVENLNPTYASQSCDYNARNRKLIDYLNLYLKSVQAGSASTTKIFLKDPKKPTEGSKINREESLLAEISGQAGFRLRVRMDIYSEYVTLSFLANGFLKSGGESAQRVNRILCDLRNKDTKVSEEDVTFLYEDFWKMLDEDPAVGLARLVGPVGEPGKFGDIIADFRGLALSPRGISQSLSSLGCAEPLQMPELGTAETAGKPVVDRRVFDFIRNRQDFFVTAHGLTRTGEPDANVVMCGVSNGAAIYGSSFGRQRENVKSPLRYILIYNGFSTAQLGRIMRRLHVLGELRVAALLDTRQVHKASAKIRMLGFEMDASVTDRRTVERLNLRLTQIGAGVAAGGLMYRVSRSRHYSRAFRERLKDLRIVRIEGWEPYDEFVRRNLFMEFDTISVIGERFEALGSRIQRLISLDQLISLKNSTRDLARYTQEAHKLTKEIAGHTKATKKLTEGIAAAQGPLIELQTIAEWVGAAAFTYYGGSATAHFLAPLTHGEKTTTFEIAYSFWLLIFLFAYFSILKPLVKIKVGLFMNGPSENKAGPVTRKALATLLCRHFVAVKSSMQRMLDGKSARSGRQICWEM